MGFFDDHANAQWGVPQPEPAPEPAPEPVQESEAQPEPQPESQPATEPEPQPAPESKPEAKPKAKPSHASKTRLAVADIRRVLELNARLDDGRVSAAVEPFASGGERAQLVSALLSPRVGRAARLLASWAGEPDELKRNGEVIAAGVKDSAGVRDAIRMLGALVPDAEGLDARDVYARAAAVTRAVGRLDVSVLGGLA
ncbi:hypothetical protein ACLUWS_06795 [Bifidobacterium boum]|uniref:hypothetical protein n=1 Tax=Bifidobacterium boum TaxID=78343 RepID=UPI0039935A60